MFTRSYGSVLVSYVPPKKEPEFAATDIGGGDGGSAGDGYACNISIDTHGRPKKEPKSERIDLYYHPLKKEPEPEIGDGDGDTVVVNGNCDCDLKEERELVAVGDDSDADSGRDVGYDCSHCGTTLSTQKFKVEHELRCMVRMKRNEFESQVTKLYHCCYCRCPFVNKEHKEQHQRRYCPKRPVVKRKDSNGPYFVCGKCEFVTKYRNSLKDHLLAHNKNNAEWITCTRCSYKTVYKNAMTEHTKIHSNAFSCCCPICGKSFRTKPCLDDHLLRQHSDEWDEFSKSITNKIYMCSICDKFRTISKTNFNLHLSVTHLKGVGCEKYECPRCPYSTFRKMNLNRHSKTHEGQKDYRCTACKKLFARKVQLDSHILYIHADNVDLMKTVTSQIHRCESCSFKTVVKTHLKSHVRSKHI